MCAGFLAFQWADHHVAREAWKDAGVRVRQECDGGDKDGICWIPNSIHPVTARRSHAGLGHYADVHASRLNYDLLVKHQVVRVVYPEGNVTSGVPLVEVLSLNDTAMQSGYKSQQTLTTTLLSNPHPQPRNPLRNRHILLRNHAPPPIPGHNPSQHLLPPLPTLSRSSHSIKSHRSRNPDRTRPFPQTDRRHLPNPSASRGSGGGSRSRCPG